MQFNCESCKIVVDRDRLDTCSVGNRWDGRKWTWDYCCGCYLKYRNQTEWFATDSCDFCLSKSSQRLLPDQRARREQKQDEAAARARAFLPWKLKGFSYIPFNLTLYCSNCSDDFEFTVGEQEFYKKKGFNNPRKCSTCRVSGKQNRK